MSPHLPVLLLFILILPSHRVRAAELRTRPPSLEYCRELAARLAPLPGAASEPARSLAAEGNALCHDGHVRTGVARLRRAMRAAQSP
jgi:hypothetical protein